MERDYADLEEMLGLAPLQVSLLPEGEGTFRSYVDRQKAAGADLIHQRPGHLNPSAAVLRELLECAASMILEDPEELLQAAGVPGGMGYGASPNGDSGARAVAADASRRQ